MQTFIKSVEVPAIKFTGDIDEIKKFVDEVWEPDLSYVVDEETEYLLTEVVKWDVRWQWRTDADANELVLTLPYRTNYWNPNEGLSIRCQLHLRMDHWLVYDHERSDFSGFYAIEDEKFFKDHAPVETKGEEQ